MRAIIGYLLLHLILLGTAAFCLLSKQVTSAFLESYQTALYAIIAGGVGGTIYCFRGVYLNACVHKNWDKVWYPWYFIRPIISLICGGVSFVFLKAGLLILESQAKAESSHVAFYAIAFIAGYNVDKFLSKVEDIAKTTWGIDKSRTSSSSSNITSTNQP